MAAEHYVRADATGNNDGSDWTNAYTAIPANPTHGDTYYLADGTYGAVEFGDESYAGTAYVNILKATSSAHGAAADWNSSYGDGQALFTTVGIQGPYFVFDGVTGSGKTGYGIKAYLACEDIVASGGIINISLLKPHSPYGNNHIYIKHIEIAGIGETCPLTNWKNYMWTNGSTPLSLSRDPSSYIFIQNNYIYDGTSNILMRSWSNSEISGNYFGPNYGTTGSVGTHDGENGAETLQDLSAGFRSETIGKELWNKTAGSHCTVTATTSTTLTCSLSGGTRQVWNVGDEWQFEPASHGQQISGGGGDNDIVVKNNIFEDSRTFVVGEHSTDANRWQIYNNIIIRGVFTAGFATATSSETDNVKSWQVHHNTFIGCQFTVASRGAVFPGLLSDVANDKSYAYNNLFYDCIGPRLDNNVGTPGGVVHDNNAYLSCTGTYSNADETDPQVDINAIATDIFTDYANGDYSLKIGTLPINNGKTDLGATYAHDYAGTERGANPDIGAYEYVGTSDIVAPASPSGLAVS